MKKKLFLLLILSIFLYVKPVDARIINVCSTCQYKTLEEVLTLAETFDDSDRWSTIYIDNSVEHVISSNHHIPTSIDIRTQDANGKEVVINGNNNTISFDYFFDFKLNTNLSLKNINFIYKGDSSQLGGDSAYIMPIIKGLEANINKIELSNFTLTSLNDNNVCNSKNVYGLGLEDMNSNLFFNNVTISNFYSAFYAEASSNNKVVINNSNFENNYFSFDAVSGKVLVDNTKLSRLLTVYSPLGEFESFQGSIYNFKDINIDAKVLPISEFSGYEDDFCEASKEKKVYIYFDGTGKNNNVTIEKSINYNNKKYIDNFLSLFTNNYDDFTITSSDPTIAKVTGKKIEFLSSGKATITARNNITNETYIANIDVVRGPDNPITGQRIIFILIIVLSLLVIEFINYKKKMIRKKY